MKELVLIQNQMGASLDVGTLPKTDFFWKRNQCYIISSFFSFAMKFTLHKAVDGLTFSLVGNSTEMQEKSASKKVNLLN